MGPNGISLTFGGASIHHFLSFECDFRFWFLVKSWRSKNGIACLHYRPIHSSNDGNWKPLDGLKRCRIYCSCHLQLLSGFVVLLTFTHTQLIRETSGCCKGTRWHRWNPRIPKSPQSPTQDHPHHPRAPGPQHCTSSILTAFVYSCLWIQVGCVRSDVFERWINCANAQVCFSSCFSSHQNKQAQPYPCLLHFGQLWTEKQTFSTLVPFCKTFRGELVTLHFLTKGAFMMFGIQVCGPTMRCPVLRIRLFQWLPRDVMGCAQWSSSLSRRISEKSWSSLREWRHLKTGPPSTQCSNDNLCVSRHQINPIIGHCTTLPFSQRCVREDRAESMPHFVLWSNSWSRNLWIEALYM